MNDRSSLQRAHLLLEQRRWDLADRELRRLLADDSQNPEAHRLLAHCLVHSKQYGEAESEARMAIHLQPDSASMHFSLGWVLFQRNDFKGAAAAAHESLRLDAGKVDAHELLSRVAMNGNLWKEALAHAEQALAIDPEDTDCNNLRAMALVKLGRRAEAGQTIDAALTRDPEDSLSHANQGWTLLEGGQRKKAMEHFRESLRLNPNNEWARVGILESMKAKNIVYRLCLKYVFLMSRMTPQQQWMLVIGFFVLQGVARSISASSPVLAPFIQPLIMVYIAFAILTWLGSPLCDLLLMLDRFGRLVLSSEQKWRALAVGGLLAAAALALGASFVYERTTLELMALNLALLAIPTSAIIHCTAGWPRTTMIAVTLLLGALGVLPGLADLLFEQGLISLESGIAAVTLSTRTYTWGIVGSQFLANWLASVEVRR